MRWFCVCCPFETEIEEEYEAHDCFGHDNVQLAADESVTPDDLTN